MPKLPEKKSRPWIPKREKKKYFESSGGRNNGDMRHFYNSRAWKSLRNYKIQLDPLCEMCKKKGLLEAGKEIDHIIAIKDNGAKLNLQNLQTLCRSCHSSKSAREREQRKHFKRIF
jgi:5-methylcytosine-specific restriction protein A